jgi:hypothetical protein
VAPQVDAISQCKATVTADLMVLHGRAGEFAPLAIFGVISAAQTLFKAVEDVALKALQYIDEKQREDAFLAFVGSADTTQKMVSALGPCAADPVATNNPAGVAALSDAEVPQCDKSDLTSPLSTTQVVSIVAKKRVDALAVAQARWSLLTKRSLDLRQQLILASSQLSADLAEYDSLRARQIDPNGHLHLVQGYRALRRIGQGQLTAAERQQVFQEGLVLFATGATSIGTSINGISSDITALDKASGKL